MDIKYYKNKNCLSQKSLSLPKRNFIELTIFTISFTNFYLSKVNLGYNVVLKIEVNLCCQNRLESVG